ncbi:hypothetical protein LEMLEM_LOCUS628, partial [Lemmus lemmus]
RTGKEALFTNRRLYLLRSLTAAVPLCEKNKQMT